MRKAVRKCVITVEYDKYFSKDLFEVFRERTGTKIKVTLGKAKENVLLAMSS